MFLAFKSTPSSREKVSNSDLQDKVEEVTTVGDSGIYPKWDYSVS